MDTNESPATDLGFPGTAKLAAILKPYLGHRAFLIPLTDARGRRLGNNGDALMHHVMMSILRDMGITVEQDPRNADVLMVPPNGALLQNYVVPSLLEERLQILPDIPLVVLPSSAYFPTADPSSIFRGRSASTTWILREPYSFNHLRENWGPQLHAAGVTLHLDHDVVASGHDYASKVLGPAESGQYLLIAARTDVEAATISATLPRNPAWYVVKRAVYFAMRIVLPQRALASLVRRKRQSRQRKSANSLLSRLPNETLDELNESDLPSVTLDVSDPSVASFNEYRDYIRSAALVVTDRLHVGMAAATLGKRVILVEAGYHKLGGVYHQSLTAVTNVAFVDRAKP